MTKTLQIDISGYFNTWAVDTTIRLWDLVYQDLINLQTTSLADDIMFQGEVLSRVDLMNFFSSPPSGPSHVSILNSDVIIVDSICRIPSHSPSHFVIADMTFNYPHKAHFPLYHTLVANWENHECRAPPSCEDYWRQVLCSKSRWQTVLNFFHRFDGFHE